MYLYRWRRFGVLLVIALGLTACGAPDPAVVAEVTADEPATGANPAEPSHASVGPPTAGSIPPATAARTAVPDTTATAPVNTPTVPNDAGAAQAADAGDPMAQPASPPPTSDANAGRELLLYGTGMVELLLTDAQGQRLGYDPTTGDILQEIPDSVYYRDTSFDESNLYLIDPEPSNYTITVTGIEAGDYEIYGWYADATARAGLLYDDGTLEAGQSETISFNLPASASDVPNPPDVQAGRDITADITAPVTLHGSFKDINPHDTHVIDWDFGDGNGTNDILKPTHTYTTSGVYTATLTVADSTGFVVSDTVQIDVTDPGD